MSTPTLEYPFDSVPEAGETREVAPGVSWIRMPLPFALDHINLWLIKDGEGVAIVDTGYALDATRDAWETILARLGKPVTRIIVTHCHPDHLGLARWLSDKTGAGVVMSQGEYLGGYALWHQLTGYDVTSMVAHFRHHGLDDDRAAALSGRGNAYARGVPSLPVKRRSCCRMLAILPWAKTMSRPASICTGRAETMLLATVTSAPATMRTGERSLVSSCAGVSTGTAPSWSA